MGKTVYKVECFYEKDPHYPESYEKARELFEELKTEYGDGVRLYDGVDNGGDHDEVDWGLLDYFDSEDRDIELENQERD